MDTIANPMPAATEPIPETFRDVIRIDQGQIKTHLDQVVRDTVEQTLNALLDAEADALCGAKRYERSPDRVDTRAGSYDRQLHTKAGEVTLTVPRLRKLPFETQIIERYRRRESSVEEALIEMYLAGVSVRRVEDITEALWGTKVSASTVSELNQKVYGQIDQWRNRPIEGEHPYVFLDGIWLKRSWGIGHTVRAAIGLNKLTRRIELLPGNLHPHEGYALYLWARDGPGRGAVVAVGSRLDRATAWLAAGCREAKREPVAVVDPFAGLNEHQQSEPHPVAELAAAGSTLPAFLANLDTLGLRDWVESRVGSSAEIGRTWTKRVRLLFVDGDHSHDAAQADWDAWARHVIPAGIVAFHNVGECPGVTQLYDELLRTDRRVREVGRVRSLRVVSRS